MEVREANDEFACRLGIISSGLSRIDQYRRFCLPVSSPARTREVPPSSDEELQFCNSPHPARTRVPRQGCNLFFKIVLPKYLPRSQHHRFCLLRKYLWGGPNPLASTRIPQAQATPDP
jgi:hypothetical protein